MVYRLDLELFSWLIVIFLPFILADTGANWDSGDEDHFLFPEARDNPPAVKPEFADKDLIEAQWVQTTNNSYFEFICCEPKDNGNCGKFFQSPIEVVPGTTRSNALNFTLQYGTKSNCYFAINQIGFDRADGKDGFESYHFDVRGATDVPSQFTVDLVEVSYNDMVEPDPGVIAGPSSLAIPSGSSLPLPAATPGAVGIPSGSASGGPICDGKQTHIEACVAVNLTKTEDGLVGVDDVCLNPPLDQSPYYEHCWSALKLDQWIPRWIDVSFPKGIENTSTLWTSRLLREVETTTCGAVPNPGCSALDDGCDSTTTYVEPQCGQRDMLSNSRRRYVSYAIRQIWKYMEDIWETTQASISAAADQVDGITDIVNPIKDTSNWLLDLFVSVASAVIGLIPYIGPALSILLEGSYTLGQQLGNELPDFSVLKPDFEPNSVDSQKYQKDTLINILVGARSTLKPRFEKNIESVLNFIQGGKATGDGTVVSARFLEMVGDGAFTSQTPVEAPKVEIQQNIQTFIISQSLVFNGWQILLLPGIQPKQMHDSADAFCPKWAGKQCNRKTVDHLGCNGELNPQTTMCDYLWYSPGMKSSFTLLKQEGSTSKEDVKSILTQLFEANPPYTSGYNLFEGAAKCTLLDMFPKEANASFDVWNQPAIADSISEWGYSFTAGSFPDLVTPSAPLEEARDPGRSFFPINGRSPRIDNVLVEFSKKEGHPVITHPIDPVQRLFEVDGNNEIDFSCLSQLNVTIANSWGGKDINGWRRHTPS